nr:hypothetical protein [Tanacetum cinerariifolium]
MHSLALKQTRKPRSDHGMPKARHSVSSSSAHHYGSSSCHGDDDEDEGTSCVFSIWMAFGRNTRDLGSFGEETDEITGLHQILEEVLLTERGDGVTSIKRRRRDLFSDDVWNLEMA